ncbi:unnamed protein product [Lactuca virosa]|uniref:Uncharacterized protein n=1 Tax=Lactuca virosa TaxID=75947 RepID=A0AAU9P993_9ASTR|nr:unnamed protein product [Lactuca virosa]
MKMEKRKRADLDESKHKCEEEESQLKLKKVKKVSSSLIPLNNNKMNFTTLRIRASPNSMFKIIKKLSFEQKKCVKELGFKSLLKLEIYDLPLRLSYYVVHNFDYEKMILKVMNSEIKVDSQSVNEMLGIPIGEKEVDQLPFRPKDDQCYNRWIKQFADKNNIKLKDIVNAIISTKEADFNFKLNFIVLFCNTLVEATSMGKLNDKILKKISSDTYFSKINGCSYMIESLITKTRSYSVSKNKSYFSGPVTYLLLLYVDHVHFDGENAARLRPAIKSWNSHKLSQREKREIEVGMFGTGKVLQRLQNTKDIKVEHVLEGEKSQHEQIDAEFNADQFLVKDIDCNFKEGVDTLQTSSAVDTIKTSSAVDRLQTSSAVDTIQTSSAVDTILLQLIRFKHLL